MVYIFGIEFNESLGFPLFLIAGLYVALSPCLFPVMPLTVFRIMGKTLDEDNQTQVSRRNMLEWVLLLCAGIFTSFIIFTFTAQLVGSFLIRNFVLLNLIVGIMLVLMGLTIIFSQIAERTFARIPIPERATNFFEKEEYSSIDLYLLGLAYSIIALPCAAPAFLAVMSFIVGTGNVVVTGVGLGLFGLGLMIPYLILVFLTSTAQTVFIGAIQRNFGTVEKVVGVIMIAFGFLFIWPFFGGPFIFSSIY
jgi:cytochrome c biogenesis protein CcdA